MGTENADPAAGVGAAVATGNPYAAWISAGSQVLGSALQPKPNQSSATSYLSSVFDSSGWNVNFGAGTIESSRAASATWQQYALLALGMVLAWKTFRKS